MNATLTSSRNGRNGHVPRGTLLDSNGEVLRSPRQDFLNQLSAGGLTYGGTTGYGQYGANLHKNSLIGWLWRGGDPDKDIGLNVQTLRERSRDAFMGIPLAAG